MRVDAIRLSGFRNYDEAEARFAPGKTILAGKNAQGKTNLLEAVWLLTGSRSFRARQDRELVGFSREFARVEADFFAGGRDQRVSLLLQPGRGRQFLQNGVKKRPSELSDGLTAVLFCPEDLNMIRVGAAARRQFLDNIICQLRPAARPAFSELARLHAGKTRILKDWREKPSLLELLEDFSQAMARASAAVIRHRAACALRLGELAEPIHRAFSGGGETLSMVYRTVSAVTDPLAPPSVLLAQLLEHQKAHKQAELAAGLCLTGAHRDDLEFFINGKSARRFASQGQTRTAALSLKLAERELYWNRTGQWPVLLLDDVLSELDETRQAFVLSRLSGGQTLITCCAGEELSQKTGGRVLRIEQGRIA